MLRFWGAGITPAGKRFNGHPPLGVNATRTEDTQAARSSSFQWAPTLGGECYDSSPVVREAAFDKFQWAPTLGGECYQMYKHYSKIFDSESFNGHPPLGVNATGSISPVLRAFELVSMGTHPWG